MYFKSLQSFRGIFALIIFFHHFKYNGGGGMFAAGGDMGVSFFFILSGFVLSQGYMRKETYGPHSGENTIRFVIKRLSKIYPLHILCLIAVIILKRHIGVYDIGNALLLQSWVPIRASYFSGNAVSWCLCGFLFFYCLFPYICRFYKSNKFTFMKLYCGLLVIYALFVIPLIPAQLQDGIIYISPLTRLFDFILGMLLWKFFKSYGSNIRLRLSDVLLALGFSTIIWYEFPTPYNLSILWWPAHAVLILYSVSTYNRLLTLTPAVKFGDVSLSFYLIHTLSIKILDIIFKKLNIILVPSVRLFTILTLTILFAFLVHYYFVEPVKEIINKRLQSAPRH